MPQKCGSSRSAVFRLNKETFFLAEIFICSESQSSSLKWSGHNVFVLLFFLQHNGNGRVPGLQWNHFEIGYKKNGQHEANADVS